MTYAACCAQDFVMRNECIYEVFYPIFIMFG